MPELRVVAVSNDGTRLVLKAADSTEYTLPIDERLRAAVRNDRARLGQIEIEVESHLRPRDIQARIRAGASAEEVAQLAGIPVERVRRFEGPVLAERAFMAERARKTPVRRPGENTGPQLGEAVQERLLLRGALRGAGCVPPCATTGPASGRSRSRWRATSAPVTSRPA
nr:septation protein SepH [Streptomyces sp. t39]